MKKGYLVALLSMLVLASTQVSAQLYIGPALQGGMTYSKNTVIEDTSRYYIKNAPSLFAAAGVDLAYQFDKNIRVQAGVQGQYRAFNLVAPSDAEGLTFTNIKANTVVISAPVSLNYRIPMGSSGNKYFNIMAGHGLDFMTKDDSLIYDTPGGNMVIDSGGSFARHELQFLKKGSAVSTVLLGVGADLVSSNGNILNISLVWGISTRQIFRGSVREWKTLHQDYNPAISPKDPEEFPDHYYEWALRGSNLSLRASYYFQLTGKSKEGKEEAPKDDDNGKVEKTEKPAKEKTPKAPKEEKAPKKKKSNNNRLLDPSKL